MQFKFPPAIRPFPEQKNIPTTPSPRFTGKTDFPAARYDEWKLRSPDDEADEDERRLSRAEAREEAAIEKAERDYDEGKTGRR